MPAVKAHLRALSRGEVSAALDTVAASKACPAAKLALRSVILTAARPGGLRGVRRSQIDPDDPVWRIPGERIRAGTEHRVPLSDVALDLLRRPRFA